MPKFNRLGLSAALLLLAGCGSQAPSAKPIGNISDERGAQAGGFQEPADNAADPSDNTAAPSGKSE